MNFDPKKVKKKNILIKDRMKRIDKSYVDINFLILVEYESLSIIARVRKEPDSIVCFSYF